MPEKKTKCEWCEKLFVPTPDNKLIGLAGTPDTYVCDDCLAEEPPPDNYLFFGDDSGNASDAKFIRDK